MTKEDFVALVRADVGESSASGVLENLEEPPGRSPAADLVALSRWFKKLSAEDKANVSAVVFLTARDTVFSFLALLDGVDALEDEGAPGKLELHYKRGKEVTLLNGEDGDYLHDIFNAVDD